MHTIQYYLLNQSNNSYTTLQCSHLHVCQLRQRKAESFAQAWQEVEEPGFEHCWLHADLPPSLLPLQALTSLFWKVSSPARGKFKGSKCDCVSLAQETVWAYTGRLSVGQSGWPHFLLKPLHCLIYRLETFFPPKKSKRAIGMHSFFWLWLFPNLPSLSSSVRKIEQLF